MADASVIPDLILAELENGGVPWELLNGAKHYKLLVAGNLAAILPKTKYTEREKRSVLNSRAQVRRVIQEAKCKTNSARSKRR